MKKLTIPFLLVVSVYLLHPVAAQSRREYCVMFYNVENLFHPSDDSTNAGDDDFTPTGVRRWNFYRYNRKIATICKVILAANGWEPPDAVCFSEIENREVLDDIIFHPLLPGQHYRPLHRDSPDHRGIDVGIIYRADRLVCIDTTWLQIYGTDGAPDRTREILSATFRLRASGDTVVIIANHWTSKYGGALETEAKRLLQARTLGKHIFGMHGISVIAGGDLNDLSGSPPVKMLAVDYHLEEVIPMAESASGHRFRTGFRRYSQSERPVSEDNAQPGEQFRIPNDSSERSRNGHFSSTLQPASINHQLTYGTYKYQGNWGSIDHVFVGGKLRAEDCRATVFRHPLLLEEDTKFTGEKPYRTYNGFSHHGGVSDHLPLLLHFVVPNDREDDRKHDQQ